MDTMQTPPLRRLARWLSIAVVVAVVGMGVLAAIVSATTSGSRAFWGAVALSVTTLAFALVGAVVVRRQPHNAVGWVLCWAGLLVITADACGAYIDGGHLDRVGGTAAAWVATWCWIAGVGLLGTYLALLFPDGHLASRRWRPVVAIGSVALVLGLIGVALGEGPIDTGYPENPLGVAGVDTLQAALLVIPAMVVLGVISQVIRFRRGTEVERQQLKWVVTTLALVGGLLVVTGVLSGFGGLQLPDVVYNLAFIAVPISIGIAILRYRLYEIDVIIRKTLIYAALAAALALLYLGGISLTTWVFRSITGQSGALAITLSTLAVAAAFQPLRSRIQRTVDRRFYRRTYDAARTLAAFNHRMREQIDINALNTEVLSVVTETLQPSHASLWLRPAGAEAKPSRASDP